MNKVWTHSASISLLTWLWTLPLESKNLLQILAKRVLLCSLLLIPAVFFFLFSMQCLFFYVFLSYCCMKCFILVLFSEMCFIDRKYAAAFKGPSLLPPCCFSACYISHLSPLVSQQVCLRSSCSFDITEVVLLSLMQTQTHRTRIKVFLQYVQRLMVAALENNFALCITPRVVISWILYLL